MSEHKIDEQWVEKGSDGKIHMYKAVEGLCEKCDISHTCNLSVDCHMERGLIAKDLGILNKDGCLPAPWDSTKYPKITVLIGNVYNIEVMEGFWFMQVRGDTLEKAIERWNRRA